MLVLPVIAPQINWPILLSDLAKVLKRNPAALLDSANEKVQTPKGLLSILGELDSYYKSPDFHMAHLSFGFLIQSESIAEIRHICATANFASSNDLGIITDDLNNWQINVTRGCRKERPPEVREVFNKIMLWIEQAGLGFIWKDWTKSGNPFCLEIKC